MEINDESVSHGFPLYTIKKVNIIQDHYRSSPPDTDSIVNQLLTKGWVLLALHTKEVSPPNNYRLVFTLGHTEASADDSVEAIYTKP